MKKLFIQVVNGKANKKDLVTIKKFTNISFTFDEQNQTGWMAEMDSKPEAELLAMRLKAAKLSKSYFLRFGNESAIDLF